MHIIWRKVQSIQIYGQNIVHELLIHTTKMNHQYGKGKLAHLQWRKLANTALNLNHMLNVNQAISHVDIMHTLIECGEKDTLPVWYSLKNI